MTQIKPKGRKFSLAILSRVHDICERDNIPYSILFRTLMSQYEEQKDASWLGSIVIGLFYPDYIRLCEAVKKEEDIYVLNRDNNKNYNAYYSQICMKSRVVLPEGREEDQPYYDYSIWAYPIFYAGSTKKEFKDNRKNFEYYLRCEGALAPLPYQKGLKRKLRAVKAEIWYRRSKKKRAETEAFFSTFLKEAQTPSKYILIPCQNRMAGDMRLADTYRDLETCPFGDLHVSCIKAKKEWIDGYYSQYDQKMMMCRPANRALIEGPEIVRQVQMVALENLCEFDRICKKHGIPYILMAGTLLGAIRHKGFIPWDDDIDVAMLEDDWLRYSETIEKELDKERFFLRTQKTDKDDNLVFYQIKRNGTAYVKGGRDDFDTHRGIALDILPFHNSPGNRITFFLQDKICRFFKTMTWAHMGHTDEKRPFFKTYYGLLAKVSNKTSSRLYYKFANAVKNKGPYLSYLCVTRNPYHKGFNQRKFFEDRCEVEFEGHMFPAPREWDEFLLACYGKDYMKLLTPARRVNRHLPARIELNGLYSFDEPEE